MARLLAAALVAAAAVGLVTAPAAVADDATAAWSVSPADASGTPDGRTRLDLPADPGATVQDHVTIANASTTEQTFLVYGADAFNTDAGGFDLQAAATVPQDVGAWVTVDPGTVTIAPLGTASVAFSVAVPAGASPGDHAGGIVVSLAKPPATDAGVVLDTRVAVRLDVRVAGELAPALDVTAVRGSFGAGWVPFARGTAHVSYEVKNTGNVTIVGVPRVRITGPFGVHLGELAGTSTQEVLPGDSFRVESTLPNIAAFGPLTSVVDMTMSAAPGPQTEIPLVSSTASATLFAVPWTGLLVLALVALAVWLFVRSRRRRRREGEELWAAMVEEARTTGVPPSHTLRAFVLVGVALALAAAPPSPSPTATPATIRLVVPPVPAGSGGAAGGLVLPPGGGSEAPGSTIPGADDASPVDAPVDEASTDDQTPKPAGAPEAGADLNWRAPGHMSPLRLGLVGLGGLIAAAAAFLLGRRLHTASLTTPVVPGTPIGPAA